MAEALAGAAAAAAIIIMIMHVNDHAPIPIYQSQQIHHHPFVNPLAVLLVGQRQAAVAITIIIIKGVVIVTSLYWIRMNVCYV